MKLHTGKIAFPIEFDNGDKQNIYFNPNDPDLSIRMKDFEGRMKQKTKELADIKLSADGTPEDVTLIERFRDVRNLLCEELDIAFGGDISEKVFKYCSPFAIVDGQYFILQFIEAVRPEIEKHIKKAKAEAESKMQKHVVKYMK